ncbi:hypothetical protein IW492_09265 [Enterococcus sp. BWB1-3]|uniref:hypothetical protein n=1 Tax=unclassified Enterococcus TaxID=2608891 RepID=UPI00192497E4|nr:MULTISPECIES: hypothetical protein [unclassified Enterococcus]MBL1229419.1 hypothetical protein [Enterococcus sp. BWB1-3]MCB5956450.1 hypothetical protein [Enterococcus sp. CWB-B31]
MVDTVSTGWNNKNSILSEKAEEQFKEVLKKVQRNLEVPEMAVRDVTELVIYLVEPIDFDERTQCLMGF